MSWYSVPGGIFTSGISGPIPPSAAPISSENIMLCVNRAETDVLVGCVDKRLEGGDLRGQAYYLWSCQA